MKILIEKFYNENSKDISGMRLKYHKIREQDLWGKKVIRRKSSSTTNENKKKFFLSSSLELLRERYTFVRSRKVNFNYWNEI